MLFDARVDIKKNKTRHPLHRCQFGLAVRKRRQRLGFSQEKLAEIADCHRNFVGLIERGEQNLSLDSMVRFAKALKCRLADLVEDAGL